MFDVEKMEETFAPDEIKEIAIDTKNYQIDVVRSRDNLIRIQYANNRFRKIIVSCEDGVLWLTEEMAATVYEFFRLTELSYNNKMTIEIPAECTNLRFSVKTAIHTIFLKDVTFDSLQISTGTGITRLLNVSVEKVLKINSAAGIIHCRMNGKKDDYLVESHFIREGYQFEPVDEEDGIRRIQIQTGVNLPLIEYTKR